MGTAKQAAGIVLYKKENGELKVLIAHMGGPLWVNKPNAWSIPKGQIDDGESVLEAAKREFAEEVGVEVDGDFIELTPIVQKSGKKVFAWAVEGEFDSKDFKSLNFKMEWPPRSGKIQEFPETDRAEWFAIDEAKKLVRPGQDGLLDELVEKLK